MTPARTGPQTAEQIRQGTMTQQAHVLDAVRPGSHPGHQAGHLGMGIHPARPGDPDMFHGQLTQARPLGEGHQIHATFDDPHLVSHAGLVSVRLSTPAVAPRDHGSGCPAIMT